MVSIVPHSASGQPPRGMSQEGQRWAATSSADAPKAYHATGEWGKRGMTFQELTRAFDAFNEAEERVAIGFAWSEDCARRLEEPLSEVKTTFADLDGLRPIFPLDEPSSTPSSSATATPVSSHRPSALRSPSNFKLSNEFGHVARPCEVAALCGGITASGTVRRASVCCFKTDEDTIKPSQKRRRSLSAISPPASPSALNENLMHGIELEDNTEDHPERPPSRLEFYDRDVENDAGSLRIRGTQALERITPGETG